MIDVSTLSAGTIWMILGVIAVWTFLGFLIGKTVGMVAEQKRLIHEWESLREFQRINFEMADRYGPPKEIPNDRKKADPIVTTLENRRID